MFIRCTNCLFSFWARVNIKTVFMFCVLDVHCSCIGQWCNEVVISAVNTRNISTVVMRPTDVIISSSSSCSKMFFYVTVLLLTTLVNHCSVSTSSSTLSFRPSTDTALRHLAVDSLTGIVYVGAVNHIYQLDSNLTLEVDESTGPVQDDKNCADFDSAGQLVCQPLYLSPKENYNQVTNSLLHQMSTPCDESRLVLQHFKPASNDVKPKSCSRSLCLSVCLSVRLIHSRATPQRFKKSKYISCLWYMTLTLLSCEHACPFAPGLACPGGSVT